MLHRRWPPEDFPRSRLSANKVELFTLVGTITAIDGEAVTVQVLGGNPITKPYIGQTVALQTTADTRFLQITDEGTLVITLSDLSVGQNVSAQGTLTGGVWVTTRITVGAKVIHLDTR